MDLNMSFSITDFSKKLFVTIVVLLFLGNFSVFLFEQVPRTWWDRNIIRGQNYLKLDDPKVVLLGSSISANLSGLNKSISNLSLSSSSALTGLILLKKNKNYPEFVIVDINFLFNDVSTNIIKEVSNFSTVAPFRFFNVFEKKIAYLHLIKVSFKYESKIAKGLDVVDLYVEKFFNNDFEKKKINENIKLFFKLYEELKNKGVKFKFYESPLDPKIFYTDKNQYTRKTIFQYISKDQVDKPIEFDKNLMNDGVHLNQDGELLLVSKINKYL
jgi:hypothetical protein